MIKAHAKVISFMILYFFIIQFSLGSFVPQNVIYNYRMDYDMIKNRPSNIEVVFEQLKKHIDQRNRKDYIVILGDSIAFSSPGGFQSSIGYYMTEALDSNNRMIDVYNLALPSAQMGDIYTLLLKMDQYGISRENVVINLLYSGFVKRDPGPPAVFWFEDSLKRLDPQSYEYVSKNLMENGKTADRNIIELSKSFIMDNFALTRYKDLIRVDLAKKLGEYETTWQNETGDNWEQKDFLRDLLDQPMYQQAFSDDAFVMDKSNLQIYFIDKIITLQEGNNTLFILADINKDLMSVEKSKIGFIENIHRIDAYFSNESVEYLNLNDTIDPSLFSDHVHLIPEGYKYFAQILLDHTLIWFD